MNDYLKKPGKREVYKQLLGKGSVFIHLDPRRADVEVPPWLRHQAQLVLQVGTDMPIPINDLKDDKAGVVGTLSFARTPYKCVVPWKAVFALVGDEGRGMVWEKSMPAEIKAEVEKEEVRLKDKRASQLPWPKTSKPPRPAAKSEVRTGTSRRSETVAARVRARGWTVIEGGNS